MTEVLEDEFAFQCYACAHLDKRLGMTCKAYPDGIPEALALGQKSHLTPYKGDGGVRFTPRLKVNSDE